MGDNKKTLGQKITAGAIVAAFLGGTIAGGVMLNEMDKLATSRDNASNLKTRASSNSSYSEMVRERDEQVWQAYDNEVIGAGEFTDQMKKTHSESYLYSQRYNLLSKEDAIAWEEAKAGEDDHTSSMVGFAIGSGLMFAGGAYGLLKQAEKSSKKDEQYEDEDVYEEDYYGA